jgi:hypothetical protein
MATRRNPFPTPPAQPIRGSTSIRPEPAKPPKGSTSLGPDFARHPSTRQPLPSSVVGPRGSTSIKPEAPQVQKHANALGPDPSVSVPGPGVGKPKPATKEPITGPMAPPPALQRPRNGADPSDGFKINAVRDRSAGRLVDNPFSPAWDEDSKS